MAKVNIPRSVDDSFYRYTMPSLRVEYEGHGKNSRTLLSNLHGIAAALNRPETWCLKWISIQLGTSMVMMNGRSAIKGQHPLHGLNDCIDMFIDMYVLCSKCRNPETSIKGHQTIVLKCKACGHNTLVPENKFTRFMIHERISMKAPKRIEAETSGDDYWSSSMAWFVSTDKTSIQARLAELKSVPDAPLDMNESNVDNSSMYMAWAQRIFPQLKPQDQKILPVPKIGLDGKTIVWTNAESFCGCIHRDITHVQSYLTNELGTDCQLASGCLTMNVRLTQQQLQKLIGKYVSIYVACGECKSLDTMIAHHDRLEFRVCNTCGSQRSLDKITMGFRTIKKGDRKK